LEMPLFRADLHSKKYSEVISKHFIRGRFVNKISVASVSPAFSILLRSTVQSFLEAVRTRNLKVFEQFFNKNLKFTAVLPGAKLFDDVQSFMDSQLPWFRSNTGTFDFTLDRTEVSHELGAAFLRAEYKNVDSENKPFALEIYISLI